MSRLNRVLIVLLVVFVTATFVVGVIALSNSSDAQSDSAKTSTAFRSKVAHDQAETIQARRAACESSTELRSLLNDIGDIVVPPGATSPRGLALIARIHRYTDHNPNCKHLPPKP